MDDKDHGQRDLTTCIHEEEEEEESDFIEEGEMVSSECGKRKKRIGRRATWKEDHITDMVNIIVNDDQLGPVVQRPISANPGLNFNRGFLIPLLKSLFGIIFSVLFEVSNSPTLD